MEGSLIAGWFLLFSLSLASSFVLGIVFATFVPKSSAYLTALASDSDTGPELPRVLVAPDAFDSHPTSDIMPRKSASPSGASRRGGSGGSGGRKRSRGRRGQGGSGGSRSRGGSGSSVSGVAAGRPRPSRTQAATMGLLATSSPDALKAYHSEVGMHTKPSGLNTSAPEFALRPASSSPGLADGTGRKARAKGGSSRQLLGPVEQSPVIHWRRVTGDISLADFAACGTSIPKLGISSYTVPIKPLKRVSTPVLAVTGLDEIRVEADTLFNIFCGFGHVRAIGFPADDGVPDKVLVEMGMTEHAQLVAKHLHGMPLFSGMLRVEAGPDGVTSLEAVRNAYIVTKYSASPLNPFAANMASHSLEKRIRPPSEMLLVSHLPKTGVTEELLAQHFEQCGGTVTTVHMKSKRRALITFATLANAVNALALLNDVALGGRHLRLSFAPA
ncbi:uncharacterized protein AMSG_12398 [Thecamonas trahens ATCC 50062]|uniref:RRM domain-containing protein n=1 Tax=Thecamonas trahens ATCC 50062 TaxID=461836 RepID=A0A0L0DUU0_THETB|nr:hypothetical protein AMSG_12398 [Thecamonas trahens ATCC 50062]KNC55278.1 hypothetical protein AMSG_12398 [Thecamonas trahens ATCC 50062]|eukprot:XP_013753131.1 hypothetical protein AMSG_12398 [Thecamonas trahens ATCC 50062]